MSHDPAERFRRVLLTLFALFGAGCETPTPGERPAPPTDRGAERAASPLVVSPKHDFGRAVQGDTLRHAFVTRNATRQAIQLERTREVLGCSAIPVPRVLAPGQAGKLEVTCRATLYGPLRVSLPLLANGRAAGELSLAADVEPLLAFEPGLLEVDVAFGTKGTAEARLTGARAAAARLAPLAPLPRGIQARVLTPANGGRHGVALQVRDAAAGTHAGSMRFATGLADPKEVELGYVVKVASTLAVSPTNPVLDLRAPAGSTTIVRVTSQRRGFRVTRVEVLEGPFDARAWREGDAYAIAVSIVPKKLTHGMHGANGRLVIVSNDRAEPTKELPLFALGSPKDLRAD